MQHATCNVLQSQLVSDNGCRSHRFMAKLTGAQQLPPNEQLPHRNKTPLAAVVACCQWLHVACNARQWGKWNPSTEPSAAKAKIMGNNKNRLPADRWRRHHYKTWQLLTMLLPITMIITIIIIVIIVSNNNIHSVVYLHILHACSVARSLRWARHNCTVQVRLRQRVLWLLPQLPFHHTCVLHTSSSGGCQH